MRTLIYPFRHHYTLGNSVDFHIFWTTSRPEYPISGISPVGPVIVVGSRNPGTPGVKLGILYLIAFTYSKSRTPNTPGVSHSSMISGLIINSKGTQCSGMEQ